MAESTKIRAITYAEVLANADGDRSKASAAWRKIGLVTGAGIPIISERIDETTAIDLTGTDADVVAQVDAILAHPETTVVEPGNEVVDYGAMTRERLDAEALGLDLVPTDYRTKTDLVNAIVRTKGV